MEGSRGKQGNGSKGRKQRKGSKGTELAKRDRTPRGKWRRRWREKTRVRP